MRVLGAVAVGLAAALFVGGAAGATSASACTFGGAFKTLHDRLPATVGACVGGEATDAASGWTTQPTTGGALVWRPDTGDAFFTDGARMVIAAPEGFDDYLIDGPTGAWRRDGSSTSDAGALHMPVSTDNGVGMHARVDLAIPGVGPSIAFARSYSSADTRVTPLGPGWTHSYNIRIRINSRGETVLVGPHGRSDVFQSGAGGALVPPYGVHTALARHADGSYTATLPTGTIWDFDSGGTLLQITDKTGTSRLHYGRTEQGVGNWGLVAVDDPQGRGQLTFRYNAASQLSEISDWFDPPRTVRFAYDDAGRLREVVDPDGRTTAYAYDGDSQRLMMILEGGRPAIVNTYDAEGRVATQRDARRVLAEGPPTAFTYAVGADGTRVTTVTSPTRDPAWLRTTVQEYDTMGRIVRSTVKPAADPASWIVETSSYDEQGRRRTQRVPTPGSTA
jgi:YD repeat-containing protein